MKIRDHYLFFSKPVGVHVDPTTKLVSFKVDNKLVAHASIEVAVDNVRRLLVHLNQTKEKLCSQRD